MSDNTRRFLVCLLIIAISFSMCILGMKIQDDYYRSKKFECLKAESGERLYSSIEDKDTLVCFYTNQEDKQYIIPKRKTIYLKNRI